jgi:hypothetical protein
VAAYGICGTGYGNLGLWIWGFGIRAWGLRVVDMGRRSLCMGKTAVSALGIRLWDAWMVTRYGGSEAAREGLGLAGRRSEVVRYGNLLG